MHSAAGPYLFGHLVQSLFALLFSSLHVVLDFFDLKLVNQALSSANAPCELIIHHRHVRK